MTDIPVLVNLARPRGEVDTLAVARAARAAGLSGIGLADSPRLFPDPLVETARVLASDPQVMAGPCVLSLPLLHVARAASALGTLAANFPGRVAAVVGRGESSLANEGIRPPRLREYAVMRSSLRGQLHGSSIPAHLLGAASGPRTISVTARELGGVLLDVGTDARAVAAAAAHARAADPGVTVWAFVRVAIAHDPAEVHDATTPLLGSCAARMSAAPEWYSLSRAVAPSVAELAAAHDYRQHGTRGAFGDPDVPNDSTRTRLARAAELVRERFILAATTEIIAERFRAIAATGIGGMVLAGGLPGVVTRLPELGVAARALGDRSPAAKEPRS